MWRVSGMHRPARAIICWLALATSVYAGAACISDAKAETVWFRSAPVPLSPMAARIAVQRGMAARPEPGDRIGGVLYRPEGAGQYPAVVALHGCTGRLDPVSEQDITQHFTERGYVVLWVDSFGARGIQQECSYVPHPVDLALDAYGALDFLAAQSFVDPTRVIVLGFAQGGTTALGLATQSGYAQNVSPHRFAASIAYSPHCYPGFATVTVPALILIGEVDSLSPAVECQAMMAQRTGAGAAERLIVFPGAYHGFNLLGLRDHPTEVQWHYMEYNEHADHAAWAAVVTFLAALEH